MRLAAIALLALTGCDSQSDMDATAADLIEWSKQNPMVTEDTWDGVKALMCRPESMQVCGPKGCKEQTPNVWLEFVPNSSIRPGIGTIRRCDAKGCDAYTADVSYSGSWATATIAGRSDFAKITASGEYIEVASLMQDVLIYRGQCEAQR